MASSSLAYICPLCDSTQSLLSEWLSHLGAAHSSDPSFLVTCGIDGCKCVYSKFSALKTHVYRHHKARLQRKSPLPLPQGMLEVNFLCYSGLVSV